MTIGAYRKPLRKLRQGDVAVSQYHQLRARSGEGKGPGPEEVVNEDLPFLGPYQDFEIPVPVPGVADPVPRILRVWTGYVVVISQSCELEYADERDTRVLVAPLVTSAMWPGRHWELIERGSLPGYCHLPAVRAGEVDGVALEADWPDCAVVLASATLVSRAMLTRNRTLALSSETVVRLQESIVRFASVRGFGDVAAAEALIGKTVVDVKETTELVPGPSRLTKCFLEGPEGGDEITVVCGVRPSKRAA